MTSRHHILKTVEPWWSRLVDGSKTAELRKHDRDFQIGDDLYLVRYQPERQLSVATMTEPVDYVHARISHILPATVFGGLSAGWSMLSLQAVTVHRCTGEEFRNLIDEETRA